MSKLLIEMRGEVTLLTLNRPEVHNNVDADLAMLLADAIIDFGADHQQKVLVIAGAGNVTFCAGANLKGMKELFEHRRTHDRYWPRLWPAWPASPRAAVPRRRVRRRARVVAPERNVRHY